MRLICKENIVGASSIRIQYAMVMHIGQSQVLVGFGKVGWVWEQNRDLTWSVYLQLDLIIGDSANNNLIRKLFAQIATWLLIRQNSLFTVEYFILML